MQGNQPIGLTFNAAETRWGSWWENIAMDLKCTVCKDARWVCEDHPDKPWDGASDVPEACHCGGAGAPCPACNPCDDDHRPEMPEGYRSLIDSRDGSMN
jgi:hypothetical protein